MRSTKTAGAWVRKSSHIVIATLPELRSKLYAAYPSLQSIGWVDEALRELYANGAPDPRPRNEGKRLIMPKQWLEFCHMVANRIGNEVKVG